jgi:MFS family permease
MVVLAVYLVFNIVYALTSYPLGRASDKIGFQPVYILGLIAFVITYAVLGVGPHSLPVLIGLFALYGVFAATEDGIAKAWLSLHIPKEYKATGLGLFMMASSFGFLVASTMTALLWDRLGSSIVLSTIALVAVLLCVYFAIIRIPTKQTP